VKFFPRVNVKEIPEARLRSADPHLISFLNINTPEDFTACEEILRDNLG
jgi:molybdopterin-guanine dinucleotide biosynthesis protein A